jgi:hypothetical protein
MDTRSYCLGTCDGIGFGSQVALLPVMRDTLRRCLAIVGAILTAYFILHVLRFVTISAEARGACAGVGGYLVGDCIAGVVRNGRRGRRK